MPRLVKKLLVAAKLNDVHAVEQLVKSGTIVQYNERCCVAMAACQAMLLIVTIYLLVYLNIVVSHFFYRG
jgi:hypothetical protein